ncbi:MAG TPA: polysaccharide biosynthesis protein [Campylobacterales bacterium]|nr:polysaccharide biosynthesis protein [Campylobacterales bacterium]
MIKQLFSNSPMKRTFFFICVDVFIFFIALYLAYQLRFNFQVWPEHKVGFWNLVWVFIFIKIVIFYLFKIYFITWRYFVLGDVRKIFFALIVSYLLFAIYLMMLYEGPFPRSAIIIDFLLSFIMIVGIRFSKRVYQDLSKPNSFNPTIIIGANQKAISVINSARDQEINFFPVAIVDENRSMINSYLSNLKVYSCDKLEYLIGKHRINSAIITKEYKSDELDRLFEKLNAHGVTNIKLSKLLGSKNEKLRDISIEDLLARHPKDLDNKIVADLIKDKIVLITGAGGSIGSEIVKQCAKHGAKQLLLLDHSEYNLYNLSELLVFKNQVPLMQSVVDKKLLEKVFQKYQPQIVIHAAAYKHVPLCEENVEGAVLNNIIGTKNCIDLSIKYGVSKFVLISTDKAVRPTNVMGATKRVSELYAQNVDSKETLITGVRFGNVLGSSGSVIPKFKKQIENNRPLTITHPDITRYFMLIPEACQLVLQAAAIAKNGELFILDMGEPIKIIDLAKKMLKIYDKQDLQIIYTGLRKGEKLYEELLIDESDKDTRYDSIFIAPKTEYDIQNLNSDIEVLIRAKDQVEKLKYIVPEFKHKI